jgi:PUA domain protein
MRRREAQELIKEANDYLVELEIDLIEEAEFEDGMKIYLLNGEIKLFRLENNLIPTLNCGCLDNFPRIIVDMGAIPYVCNGADIMVPGIVSIKGDFKKGEIVVIRDENHKKDLAIGKAMEDSGNIRRMNKGKVVENLHYVGDRLWDILI